MEFQLQQRFGSPAANLGLMANLHPRQSTGRMIPVPPEKLDSSTAAGTHDRAHSTAEPAHLQFEDVVERLKRGEKLTPRDAVAAFDLGWAYKTLGRWVESADTYTKALEFLAEADSKYRDLNMATAYYARGYAYASLAAKQGRDEAKQTREMAERDFLEALRLNKDYALVYCYLGVLYGEQGRWGEAEKAFKRAIKLQPRYAGAHHDLGVIYAQSGRPKLAIKEFEKAAEYEPKNLLALRHLAEFYYNAGRWEDARKILLRVLKLAPGDHEALYKLGGVYLHFGDFAKAEDALHKVLEQDPDDVTAHFNLGFGYLKSGHLGDAAAAFRKALELPGDAEIEGVRTALSAVQHAMLEVIADAYLGILSYGIELDIDSLVAQAVKVREMVSAGEDSLLEAPNIYFPDELMHALAPIVQQLDEETGFLLAAKLFERGLLSSGKASRLIGMERVPFLGNLHRVGVAMIALGPEDLEEELRYASAE
jgi:tetratricopeptide (TPR) repeat protein